MDSGKCNKNIIIVMSIIRFIVIFILFLTVLQGNSQQRLLISENKCKLWWAGSTYKIMHDSPVPEKNGKVILWSAKNETESFQLVLNPSEKLENITVKVSDFRNKDGKTISSENIIIRTVEYVHVTKPSGRLHEPGWYPDPLPLYKGTFSAVSGTNTPVWFTVNIPKDTESG